MSIKISGLKKARREGKAVLTHDTTGEVVTEEIPISFLKPTEELWDALVEMEKSAGEGEEEQKGLLVRQLCRVDFQSPAFIEDDGTPHAVTVEDLRALDFIQLAQLWAGVKDHFFLRTQPRESETTTSSSSAQAAS
jgi:hypothetical protein